MSEPSKSRNGTGYLQVRPDGVFGLKVVKATQRQPSVVDPDCVIIKIQLRIPDAAFQPLEPELIITVPETLVQHPVEVEAVNPS